jgi:hypothetical protein
MICPHVLGRLEKVGMIRSQRRIVRVTRTERTRIPESIRFAEGNALMVSFKVHRW